MKSRIATCAVVQTEIHAQVAAVPQINIVAQTLGMAYPVLSFPLRTSITNSVSVSLILTSIPIREALLRTICTIVDWEHR